MTKKEMKRNLKEEIAERIEKEKLYSLIQEAKYSYYELRDEFMRKYNVSVYTYWSNIKKRKSLFS